MKDLLKLCETVIFQMLKLELCEGGLLSVLSYVGLFSVEVNGGLKFTFASRHLFMIFLNLLKK